MLDSLSNLLAVLIALSVAAERLVSIIKNFSPFLRTEQTDQGEETKRQNLLHIIAIFAGTLTAFLAQGMIVKDKIKLDEGYETLETIGICILLGLLASGGSSFWTSILGYVNNIKDIKQTEAIDTKVKTAAAVSAIANGAIVHPIAMHGIVLEHKSQDTAQPLAGAAEAKANLEKAIGFANARL